ncbi:hypothetical protein [Akkermansia muciniphila]|uniref:hypothetical protein n=1 Tax=Akkermansia muciniphila TaxID=239935 RepID=UPI000FFF1F85|nr:hypothetical protein [Akkermansia muciniphila]MBT8787842.1 hypothetical protein [Akkermansia muciniphila]QWP56195.1 hypothetical protein J5W52_00525 [Akkermansia muciniphila]QWP58508.1 hypothetical protein J5W45_00525 [Akkermansia muciniphila]
MNLCGVRLVRRQDVPVSLSFLGRELEAGRVTLAAYHKRNGQLLAYQEEQITDGAVAMVVDFDTQEIRAAARDAEGKTIEAQVAVLVETEEGKGVYHSLPLNFYLEPGLIGDEHLPNSARPAWEMMYETVVKKAEETEGYAGSALASKRAAAASEAAAGTSATNAARDAKSAHAAKTAVESLATTWPETVREGKQQIIEARNEAVTAIQDKQADSVLAVGRASQTAQQNIASAQSTAVQAVQTAQTEAVGAVTPLVQRAETAKEAIDQAERRINTAATNATTAATSAASSATAAQQALEAIPEVDASGNMTLAGGLTAAGAINANGGVNIPLAVGAPTDTAAVNRLHAAGLAGVTDIFSQHAYLNTGSITATGTAATTAFIPGQYAQVRVPAGTHSTIVFPFTGPNGQHNYSNFAGFSIPWRILGAGKITIGIGRGSKTTRSDLTQGSYSIIPGNNLAHNSGEILDITFDNVRDATRGGYVVKVREIYALSKAAGWRVKTTTSFVPATHNEPIPSIVNKIIYHQRTQYKFESEYISYGSLYLLTGGGQTVQLHKIAAVRGVNAFETGLGISSIVTDLPGNASGDVYMQAGSAVRTLYQPGNINPVYYALEALARNDIEAEETADFVDINIPL